MTGAYVLGGLYSVVEFMLPMFGTIFFVLLDFTIILAALAVFNGGLTAKYGGPSLTLPMAVIIIVAVAAVYLVQDYSENAFTRMIVYQIPYVIMQLIGAGIIWTARRMLTRFDFALMILLMLSATQFFTKPFLAHMFNWAGDPGSYGGSVYSMISQSLGTVFAVAIALAALLILGRDILSDATKKSETDALSGLLNRGGFKRYAEDALKETSRRGMPISLIIADLDHFKDVNDSFGHASGDRVIEVFAGFLHASAAEHQVAGRLGGEEFAIILPGANLAAARLFAEGARNAFSNLQIDGLPEDRRFTASFGVAQLAPGEGISELLRRADEALYEAKKGGRDCVRLSVAPGQGKQGLTVASS
ncbi:GGDEF domain-containing protein [Mesorhizobium sp. SB112]|uniref:GGDEF domain-containing protein n=1 Tax=Mesorhizobium sp. SB112 TaxID=3151853 RepID=UPI003264698A